MRYIAQPRLDAFSSSRKTRQERETAQRDLAVWSKLVRAARWSNFGELKQTFGSADQVGNCVVFDVGNNRYRLIGRVKYDKGIVYVLKVMDHGEYDKKKWPDECGCFQPPPKKTAMKVAAKSKAPPKKKRRLIMATRTASPPVPDTYFDLVKEFPLVHIRDASHLDEALEMVDRLLVEDLDEGAEKYLDVLTDMIEFYERDNFEVPDVTEADVLRELMRANGLSQPALGRAVDISQSTISAVLTGKRSLTKEHIIKLARHFNIEPAAFLPV